MTKITSCSTALLLSDQTSGRRVNQGRTARYDKLDDPEEARHAIVWRLFRSTVFDPVRQRQNGSRRSAADPSRPPLTFFHPLTTPCCFILSRLLIAARDDRLRPLHHLRLGRLEAFDDLALNLFGA
jgi:hypothetical protein